MWRFGFGTPINYSDNEVFCGGVGQQFKKNKGKCGVCGDDWSAKRPRLNENGGKWGTGTVGKTYFQGQAMEVEVELTTNHWGWFEFKLCPVNDKTRKETQKFKQKKLCCLLFLWCSVKLSCLIHGGRTQEKE